MSLSKGPIVAGLTVALAATTVGAGASALDELHPSLFGEGVFTTAAYDFVVALTRELMRVLGGPGNGLGDIYSIPIEALEIPR